MAKPKREFCCEYDACPEKEYHRHCVRCGDILRRAKGILCSKQCRALDHQWLRASRFQLARVQRPGEKQPRWDWVPRRGRT